MPLIAFAPSYPGQDIELPQFERLAATLSSRFARLHVEEIAPAIAGALEEIGRAVGVDACTLVEFAAADAISAVHGWPSEPASMHPAASGLPAPRWMLNRLARNEVVPVTCADDVPAEERDPASGRGAWASLGVPVLVSEQVVCAMIVWARRANRPWPDTAVERIRLIAEILGVALQRCRHAAALRASFATIERLNAALKADNVYLQEEIKTYHDFDEIVGESASLRLALTRLGQVAPMNSSVLLLGETGTGKELFARALHDRSRRRGRALVRVNCAALPPTLVESELFGHEKGAFTGAVSMRQGRFELADGGTIFLDEIGDLQPEIQAKLLRVLQEGEFERVGSSRMKKVDVRIIAATHRDLEADVASGRFRADLFYRLSVFPIHLPALRERREDIPHLVWFFIHRHQRDLGRSITKVPHAVMESLQQQAWPGNVRELENVIERAMIQTSGETLQLDDMYDGPRRTMASEAAAPGDSLDAVQRAHIENVLQACGWRVNGANNAAARLGLHPNTLRFRMKKLGIVTQRLSAKPAAARPGA
jgi:transcriptional regulator with GAF, ATPase, and Fis domain